ncbi:hypothetical protein CDD80_6356 [Ophiocordyceps camponoti-rufipedis]|uniref:Uncharacterized protein n=1 Tax=Ophiocordyceps camponoti-rufipedis TaxID=2004952 RepID=A0A2C5ZHP3_9HYPO|nr:hypothetical protein CDD80_6356 [Ophiocordyceps camponoti-rufipedis]
MADSGWLPWTALCLSLLVLAHLVATYWAAYSAAPHEVAVLVDAVDFSLQDKESYDGDVATVQRLEDKMRLGRLLREIHRGGDDLREHLARLLVDDKIDDKALTTAARLLWASHRVELRDKLRTLDLLRMRFLVVYMGAIAVSQEKPTTMTTMAAAATTTVAAPVPSALHKQLAESIARRPPPRRLTTQAIGHQENVATPQRRGWAGVVEELQTSPRMQRRHASLEQTTMRP